MDQLEAQGLQTLQNKAESSLARPRLVGSCSLELETPQQVMSQHRDLLPGRVGPVVMGGDDVESPLPLKLAEGLLLRSSSSWVFRSIQPPVSLIPAGGPSERSDAGIFILT